MNTIQKGLHLTLKRDANEPAWVHKAKQSEINRSVPRITPQKLFADLLKRLARKIMADVTECPPDTIGAHMARLDDLMEIFGHCLRHEFKETAESSASGAQLCHPYTLLDFLEALRLTKLQHRAPAFVNERDTDLKGIREQLNIIAGLLQQRGIVDAVLEDDVEPSIFAGGVA